MDVQPLLVSITTFNCGRALVDSQAFAEHFFKPQRQHALPDVVVLSLQELAPLSYSFLGGTWLVPYFSRIVEAVKIAGTVSAVKYEHVLTRNVGMIGIVILAKSEIAAQLYDLQTAGVGVGNYGLGNKGAVGVRFSYGESSKVKLTFVAAHLAPMEEDFPRRNEDWKNIVEGLAFKAIQRTQNSHSRPHVNDDSAETENLLPNGELNETISKRVSGMFESYSPVFFAGDLNYRTSDKKPEPNTSHTFPQPDNGSGRITLSEMKAHDQLDRERAAKQTLHGLLESPIDFPPTYKYSENQPEPWPSDGSEPSTWHWAAHRYPSWCDRILYSSGLTSASNALNVISYSALPLPTTSDHRPVTLAMELDLNALAQYPQESKIESDIVPFRLRPDWESRRAAARRREFIVGSFSYLGSTWEGNALLFTIIIGASSGWLMISSMVAA